MPAHHIAVEAQHKDQQGYEHTEEHLPRLLPLPSVLFQVSADSLCFVIRNPDIGLPPVSARFTAALLYVIPYCLAGMYFIAAELACTNS